MARIHVDGQSYEVDPQRNLLDVCLNLGFDLPYFCWHPAMGSVGACRQCAVTQYKDENDTHGRIVMACMSPASDGSRISIRDDQSKHFRARIIEWLMVNHPHDCPVCDEGGECHLQDMTHMTGHVYRRYRFAKRTYRNQYLGPFIEHEMNRCIQCYRCVRFYRDYAGGRDLDVFGAHDHVYFGRAQDGVLENPFSGNLVEVCPTGVFTDKTLRQHYTRKWDLTTAPSVCSHCGIGCNTTPGERGGTLRRIRNRFHHEINGYFLCDRGRFGYEFVNARSRPKNISVTERLERDVGSLDPDAIIAHLRKEISEGGILGVGSARASLETNAALKELVGPEAFCTGWNETEHELMSAVANVLRGEPKGGYCLADVEAADAVLVLGEDVSQSAPRLALTLRQTALNEPQRRRTEGPGIPPWHDAAVRTAIQDRRGPFFSATPQPTDLDDVATRTFYWAPDDIARLGFAVADELDPGAPEPRSADATLKAMAADIAKILRNSRSVAVISGTSCRSEALIESAANVARALRAQGTEAGVAYAVPECNSVGLSVLRGMNLAQGTAALTEGRCHTTIVAENDLFERAPRDQVERFFEACRRVYVLDTMETATCERADAVFPAAAFSEGTGTVVNHEGRAQRRFQVHQPAGDIQDSWQWLSQLKGAPDAPSWATTADVLESISARHPEFREIASVARHDTGASGKLSVPRQPHRYSGRTALTAHQNVHEPKPPDDPESPLRFSMEGQYRTDERDTEWLPRYWVPGWNSVQSLTRFQGEVGGPLRHPREGSKIFHTADRESYDIYFASDLPPFEAQTNQWLVVPAPMVFGSEEMSSKAPALTERILEPLLFLGADEARELGLDEGATAELSADPSGRRFYVRIDGEIPRGIARVFSPAGQPGMQSLPRWSGIRPGRSS